MGLDYHPLTQAELPLSRVSVLEILEALKPIQKCEKEDSCHSSAIVFAACKGGGISEDCSF